MHGEKKLTTFWSIREGNRSVMRKQKRSEAIIKAAPSILVRCTLSNSMNKKRILRRLNFIWWDVFDRFTIFMIINIICHRRCILCENILLCIFARSLIWEIFLKSEMILDQHVFFLRNNMMRMIYKFYSVHLKILASRKILAASFASIYFAI